MRGQTASAALFLLVVPGFLAEVGSQNTPLLAYLSPVTFLLGTLTYGVPLLVIRELAAARSLNAAGIAIPGPGIRHPERGHTGTDADAGERPAALRFCRGAHPTEAVAAGILFVVIFASLLRAVSRQPFGRGATAPATAATGGIA